MELSGPMWVTEYVWKWISVCGIFFFVVPALSEVGINYNATITNANYISIHTNAK